MIAVGLLLLLLALLGAPLFAIIAASAMSGFAREGIDLQAIYDELLADGVAAFEKSYLDLLETINAKSAALSGGT